MGLVSEEFIFLALERGDVEQGLRSLEKRTGGFNVGPVY